MQFKSYGRWFACKWPLIDSRKKKIKKYRNNMCERIRVAARRRGEGRGASYFVSGNGYCYESIPLGVRANRVEKCKFVCAEIRSLFVFCFCSSEIQTSRCSSQENGGFIFLWPGRLCRRLNALQDVLKFAIDPRHFLVLDFPESFDCRIWIAVVSSLLLRMGPWHDRFTTSSRECD